MNLMTDGTCFLARYLMINDTINAIHVIWINVNRAIPAEIFPKIRFPNFMILPSIRVWKNGCSSVRGLKFRPCSIW